MTIDIGPLGATDKSVHHHSKHVQKADGKLNHPNDCCGHLEYYCARNGSSILHCAGEVSCARPGNEIKMYDNSLLVRKLTKRQKYRRPNIFETEMRFAELVGVFVVCLLNHVSAVHLFLFT